MINITNSAVEKLKEVIARQQSPQDIMIRVSLEGYG